jgi:hypothetical protein
MKRWALVVNDVAVQIVEQAEMPGLPGTWQEVTGLFVGPGFTWDGTNWNPPANE